MTEFVSDIKTIACADSKIFSVLSDLNNLEVAKNRIPQDKIKDFSFDRDSCTLSVDPVGKVKFVIIERTPSTTIKFEAQHIPFSVNVWIQLKSTSENETKMKLTIRAELNAFLKPMVSKPLQQAVAKMAEMLSSLPYDNMSALSL